LQIFFRFERAASDLGVWPATYSRSSTNPASPFLAVLVGFLPDLLAAFFDFALAVAFCFMAGSKPYARPADLDFPPRSDDISSISCAKRRSLFNSSEARRFASI